MVLLRGWARLSVAAPSILLLTTCTNEPTVPSGIPGIVAVQPVFSPDVHLAALSLPLNAVRLVVVRPPDDTIADTLATFNLDDSSLRLSLSVPLRQQAESLDVSLDLLSTNIRLFSGSQRVEVRRGGSSDTPVDIPLAFVGPGANVATLRIAPRDTFLALSGVLQFQLDAFDGQGLPVSQFYANWSTSSGSLVNSAGLFRTPALRGNTVLRAVLPNGVRDSTRVWFVPLPTDLNLVSGDGQTGPIGTLLATPLRVQVLGQDQLGVGGVPVRFRSLTGGGSPADTTVVTDTLGFAQVGARLGTLIGNQTYEASTAGLAPLVYTLIATAGVPASLIANSVINQAATVLSAVTAPPSVLVRDAQANPVPGVMVTFAITAGGGTIQPATTVVTNGSGVATLTRWVLGTVAGSNNNVVQASVPGLTGSPVSFTASGLVGPASRLAPVTQPLSTAGIGVALTQQPVLQLQDSGGNAVAQAGVVVTATIGSSPGGTPSLLNATATTVTNGRATFAGLTVIGLLGNYTLVFSAPSITNLTSSSFALGVGPVAAAQSLVAAAPGTIQADSADAATVTVTARDLGGNPVAGATVVLAVSGGGNTIVQPANTNTSGVTTGRFVTIAIGSKTVSASAAGVAITQTAVVSAVIPPRVVFSGDSVGGTSPLGVFVVNSNGTVRRNISTLGGNGQANPRLSPDGTRVVFSAAPVGSFIPGIHIAAADGSGFATVVSDTTTQFPRYNATGTHIAFRCGNFGLINQDVCVVPNVNVSLAALTNKGNGAGKIFVTSVVRPLAGGPSAFAWDPINPNRIAIVRDTVLANNVVHRLFFANFDGTGVTGGTPLIIGADSMKVQEIAWAPNGNFLVLAAEDNFQRRLYRINVNGTGLTQLTNPPLSPVEVEDAHPEISPDNTQILFLRSSLDFEGSIWNYFVMPVAGPLENVAQVSNESIFAFGSQAMTGDWSPDGSQFVLVGTEPTLVGIYIMPSSTRAATYLVNRQRISGGLNRGDGSPSMRGP